MVQLNRNQEEIKKRLEEGCVVNRDMVTGAVSLYNPYTYFTERYILAKTFNVLFLAGVIDEGTREGKYMVYKWSGDNGK